MECAQEELRKLLKKCENKQVNLKQVKVIENFLNAYCKPTASKEKWLKFVIIMGLLTYGLHYYFNDMRSRVINFPFFIKYFKKIIFFFKNKITLFFPSALFLDYASIVKICL